ncbi:glycoside hydrolase family protein [Cohnella rhizosphaerae]|uniref:Glycosyl hydrolase family 32 N-terminal domain-containing protein n=1 Tax=Cohnella rhizosphaerae TaxID=1457232 RepID=A0A9X4L137_9BACL|nr:hypothetical protein [Cohnella rhizosphaerae]MDG0814593.1 hypothetical protein [Cohnella rhizosphaerae]
MLYKPREDRLWDCWIVPHNDRYHLFYIRITPGASRWNGISMAVSDDLLHWKEYGPILEKHPDAEWLGTGMVQRVGDTFIMNYSEELIRGHQQIRFARSKDLYHWERIEEVVLRPDPAYYLDDPEDCCEELPRWDSLGIVNALQDAPPPVYRLPDRPCRRPEAESESRRAWRHDLHGRHPLGGVAPQAPLRICFPISRFPNI